jgi:hypothetical protein
LIACPELAAEWDNIGLFGDPVPKSKPATA